MELTTTLLESHTHTPPPPTPRTNLTCIWNSCCVSRWSALKAAFPSSGISPAVSYGVTCPPHHTLRTPAEQTHGNSVPNRLSVGGKSSGDHGVRFPDPPVSDGAVLRKPAAHSPFTKLRRENVTWQGEGEGTLSTVLPL
ncbi:hypothetical protein SKAU_G00408820 [Synaphobranchus kaupii]|uniref:Uncharacterized protein n=1 Tax=Synaphobranchus kaupii TaxID=118154 RepID=A0A9Q1EAI4_SYNKA|nr:hypothetical protein SKAU_G00408820 [Synaphobranchus kaupii]